MSTPTLRRLANAVLDGSARVDDVRELARMVLAQSVPNSMQLFIETVPNPALDAEINQMLDGPPIIGMEAAHDGCSITVTRLGPEPDETREVTTEPDGAKVYRTKRRGGFVGETRFRTRRAP